MAQNKMTHKDWRDMCTRSIRYHTDNGSRFGISYPYNKLGHKIHPKGIRDKKRDGKVKHNCFNCVHVNGKDIGCGGHYSPRIHPPCKGKLWEAGNPYRFWRD